MTPYILVQLFDWEELMLFVMGFAALGYIINDWRNNRHITDILLVLESRVSRLESNSDDSLSLEVRMARVEAATDLNERLDERIALIQERMAIAETRMGYTTVVVPEEDEDEELPE